MARVGTPTVCQFKSCGGAILLHCVTAARISTSFEFSCADHGWIGYFVPDELIEYAGPDGAGSKPILDSNFSIEELTELLTLARLGVTLPGSGGVGCGSIYKLARRLDRAMADRRRFENVDGVK